MRDHNAIAEAALERLAKRGPPKRDELLPGNQPKPLGWRVGTMGIHTAVQFNQPITALVLDDAGWDR